MNLLMEQFYIKLLNQISRCYSQENSFSVLDIGCGIGVVTKIVSQNFPNARITGFDLSREVVKSAKLLLPSTDIYVGDIHALPHNNHSFDLVICLEVIEHLDQPNTILDNISKACKKYSIFSIPNDWKFRAINIMRFKYLEEKGNSPDHIHEWNREDFVALLSHHFKVVNISGVIGIWNLFLCEKLESIN